LAFSPTKQQIELNHDLLEGAFANPTEALDDDRLAQGVNLVSPD